MVVCAFGVFAGPEAEVASELDQVGNMVGLGVRCIGFYGNNGANSAQGDSFFPTYWGILDPIDFEMPGDVLLKTGTSL